jgi:hypothetical protein
MLCWRIYLSIKSSRPGCKTIQYPKEWKKEAKREDLAFGSGDHLHLKTLHPRAFPLERLHSLYVNIVNLYADLTQVAEISALQPLGDDLFIAKSLI